jgi:hypothetical protein
LPLQNTQICTQTFAALCSFILGGHGKDGSFYWFDLRCKENASVMDLGKEPVASICFSPGNDDILYAAYGNTATCLDMRMAPSSGQLQKYTLSALLQYSTAKALQGGWI